MDSPMIRVLKYLEAGNELITPTACFRFCLQYGLVYNSPENQHAPIQEWPTWTNIQFLRYLEEYIPDRSSSPIEDVRQVEI